MKEKDVIDQKIDESISTLLEHCDSVRIFVTIHTGENSVTAGRTKGGGNFYAQRGQLQEWITRQEEYERIETREDKHERESGDE